jgi:hypothetical protein
MKKLVYIAGPYTSDTCEGVAMNVRIAEEHGKQVLLAGHVPLVPHRISAMWDLDDRFAGFSHSDWLEKFCFPLLKACQAIYLFSGWTESPGAVKEFEFAAKHNIPVVYTIDELRYVFQLPGSVPSYDGPALEAR